MRVMITGGAGFIGSHLAHRLVQAGVEVVSYDIVRPSQPVGDVAYILGTVLDDYMLRRAMRGCDALVHLAAMMGVRRTEKDRLICMNVNTIGTQRALEAAVAADVQHVILSSSSEVFGDVVRGKAAENDQVAPKSGYAISKLAAEEFVRSFALTYGFNFTIVRFFNIYGPGQVSAFVVPRFVKQALAGESITVYGAGDQIRSFCYVSDAVDAVTALLMGANGANETYHIGNDTAPISVRELASLVCATVKSNGGIVQVPFEDSDRSAQREIVRRIPEITKLRVAIGYNPKVTLADGVAAVAAQAVIPSWQNSEILGAWKST